MQSLPRQAEDRARRQRRWTGAHHGQCHLRQLRSGDRGSVHTGEWQARVLPRLLQPATFPESFNELGIVSNSLTLDDGRRSRRPFVWGQVLTPARIPPLLAVPSSHPSTTFSVSSAIVRSFN